MSLPISLVYGTGISQSVRTSYTTATPFPTISGAPSVDVPILIPPALPTQFAAGGLADYFNAAYKFQQTAEAMQPLYGKQPQAQQVEAMLSAYNRLMTVLDQSGALLPSNPALVQLLGQAIESRATSLKAVGVTVGGNGHVAHDPEALQTALSENPGAVSQALSGPNGFAADAVRLVQDQTGMVLRIIRDGGGASSVPTERYMQAALMPSFMEPHLEGVLLNARM